MPRPRPARNRRTLQAPAGQHDPRDATPQPAPLHRHAIAPRRGWPGPGGGRAAHIERGAVYLGTSTEVAGLFPFLQASSLPAEGVPIGPNPFTRELVCLDPAGWVGRLTSNPGVFIHGQPGVGKALDVDTPIPTPSGWQTMRTLTAGDQVFDEYGQPTEVTATSPVQTGRDCRRVLFDDGADLVADTQHLWLTCTPRHHPAVAALPGAPHRPPPPGSDPGAHGDLVPAVVSTAHIAATLTDPTGAPRHAVLCCPPPPVPGPARRPASRPTRRPGPGIPTATTTASIRTGTRLPAPPSAPPVTRYRYVVAVQPVPSRPVRCIQVASPRGLFLAGRHCVTTHNSAVAKRVCLCLVGYGYRMLAPGDVKGEYRDLVQALGGQVVRIGRGLDRINPLDSGPLGRLLPTLPGPGRDRLTAEVNGRRAELLHALLATPHGLARRPTAPESTALHTAIALAVQAAGGTDPTIPDVITTLRQAPAELMDKLMARTDTTYLTLTRHMTTALENLCSGPLAGLFDAPTTTHLDLDAPAVSIDLSAILTAGDTVIAAGLLATWAYSYSAIDTARAFALADRPLVLALDELWRTLRAGPGMVDAMDAITRLSRTKGEVSLLITHSLRDLAALPTAEDRAKALGLMERCDTVILAAMPSSELQRFAEQKPLTDRERALVTSWAAPTATGIDGTTQRHPARGHLLIKIGHRVGTPARLHLTPAERRLYNTDPAAGRQPHRPAAADDPGQPPPGTPARGTTPRGTE
ncbi:hypothetical protein AGRA3207_007465 [Actinomadura graeca]|uniref:ATP/GTP-binding protein n=1 Tax=Actinomadura graeca TaxID=2750812 RepID=A0ABX8R7H2_9ACTN|nr:hypothetical protein [Actinomadura graeca]QXJ25897.1 hypothetical protein AGRA3207_007465 [Actinomadura graeca]